MESYGRRGWKKSERKGEKEKERVRESEIVRGGEGGGAAEPEGDGHE